MSEMVQFERPDGQKAPGYFVGSAKGKNSPGVVLIQEWWGLGENIKNIAVRLAEEGFHVLVPDLYRGRLTKNAEEANRWMGELNFPDVVHQDLPGAADYLGRHSSKVAVMGFCLGGALTLAEAVHGKGLACAVCFYGIPPAALADPKNIQIPIQFHFANRDDWCTPEAVGALEKTLKETKANFELYRYEAEHAFFNDSRPEVYDPQSSKTAWERTLKFLKDHG